MVAAAMLPRAMGSDQRGDSGIGSGQGLGQRRAKLQRLTTLATAEIRKTAQRAGNQMVPLPIGVWPVRAKTGHSRQYDMRIAGCQVIVSKTASCQGRLGFMRDHYIGPAEQLVPQRQVVRVGRINHNAALRRVGIQKRGRRFDVFRTCKRTASTR